MKLFKRDTAGSSTPKPEAGKTHNVLKGMLGDDLIKKVEEQQSGNLFREIAYQKRNHVKRPDRVEFLKKTATKYKKRIYTAMDELSSPEQEVIKAQVAWLVTEAKDRGEKSLEDRKNPFSLRTSRYRSDNQIDCADAVEKLGILAYIYEKTSKR